MIGMWVKKDLHLSLDFFFFFVIHLPENHHFNFSPKIFGCHEEFQIRCFIERIKYYIYVCSIA